MPSLSLPSTHKNPEGTKQRPLGSWAGAFHDGPCHTLDAVWVTIRSHSLYLIHPVGLSGEKGLNPHPEWQGEGDLVS